MTSGYSLLVTSTARSHKENGEGAIATVYGHLLNIPTWRRARSRGGRGGGRSCVDTERPLIPDPGSSSVHCCRLTWLILRKLEEENNFPVASAAGGQFDTSSYAGHQVLMNNNFVTGASTLSPWVRFMHFNE